MSLRTGLDGMVFVAAPGPSRKLIDTPLSDVYA